VIGINTVHWTLPLTARHRWRTSCRPGAAQRICDNHVRLVKRHPVLQREFCVLRGAVERCEGHTQSPKRLAHVNQRTQL